MLIECNNFLMACQLNREQRQVGPCVKGPSIYDVHPEGSGSGGRMWPGEEVKSRIFLWTS